MKLIRDIVFFTALGLAGLFVYLQYWDDIKFSLFGEEARYTVFLGTVPLSVTVADEPDTRTRGLSGVESLGANEGKLFVFDQEGMHGIWMKDMLIPLDIVWINDNMHIVHIEERVSPETYPSVFSPDAPARFVLEVNTFFIDIHQINVGDRLFLPPELLPSDIRRNLQQ